MTTFLLPKPWLINQLHNYMYESNLDKGLIVVCGHDQGWVDFMLLGLLANYQKHNYKVVCKNDPNDNYYFKHLAENHKLPKGGKELHYYGAIRDCQKLEQTLESAKGQLTIAAMHVLSPEGVTQRMHDMLGDKQKDFEPYENLLNFVVASEVENFGDSRD